MPLSEISEDEAERVVQGVRPGESVFFVTEHAGFLYLVTGARDPTPYDVPAASNIGSRELASIAADVRSGAIGRACFGGRRAYTENPSLRPFAVERVLRRSCARSPTSGSASSTRVTQTGDRQGRRKADSSLDQCFAVHDEGDVVLTPDAPGQYLPRLDHSFFDDEMRPHLGAVLLKSRLLQPSSSTTR